MTPDRSPRAPSRRRTLGALGALLAVSATGTWARSASGPAAGPRSPPGRLLAAWQAGTESRVGRLTLGHTQLHEGPSVAVPTRAHGLLAEPGGSALIVARRPGDWLLRWHPGSGQTQWHWVDDDRRFNGHAWCAPHGDRLWTTETALDTAEGMLGVRDTESLEKTAEWPTLGMDPHQVLALPEPLGDCPAGTLLVANGGIPTLPETGRSKRQLARMDASLVALHPQTGSPLGQWRLTDPFLSLRHLAWDPRAKRVGVALQAEHADEALRRTAPVLAVWDGRALTLAEGSSELQGYGGDLCAKPGGGFVVSCPRADALALFDPWARHEGQLTHAQACALASDGRTWCSGGRDGTLVASGDGRRWVRLDAGEKPARILDNHWLWLPPGPAA